MANNQGKLTVAAAIIIVKEKSRMHGHFKLTDVVNETGLTSSLVTYHLQQLVKQSVLTKVDTWYAVTDLEKLTMILSSERETVKHLDYGPTQFFPEAKYQALKELRRDLNVMKALKLPHASLVEQEFKRELDFTIKMLQSMKQSREFSRASAAKKLARVHDFDSDSAYKEISGHYLMFKIEFDKDLLRSEISQAVNDEAQ